MVQSVIIFRLISMSIIRDFAATVFIVGFEAYAIWQHSLAVASNAAMQRWYVPHYYPD